MIVSDPILYPITGNSPEALRQETERARAELARTVEELADRMTPRRLARPAITAPIVGGLVAGAATAVALSRVPRLRGLAWLGGLAVAALVLAAGRALVERDRPAGRARPHRGEGDVVDVLMAQHRRVDPAFAAVREAEGADKLEAFAVLVDLLKRHEHTEQEVVHPVLRRYAPEIAQARVDEERAAERALASLIAAGVDDPGFDAGLTRLQESVHAHAEHEETEEFPVLRARVPAAERQRMAGRVRFS